MQTTPNLATLSTRLKQSGFLLHTQPDGYTLVHPARNKFDWREDELAFRSVVLAPDGRIVSTGWPKFFNQGEFPAHDERIAAELEAGRAVITHKHDGSLLIRSVLPDGRILLRTRGSFDGGDYAPRAEAIARRRYPILLDPDFFADGSLLFEYVGADNQIVVRYAEEDLIFLGAARHEPSVTYLPFAELAELGRTHAFNLVETYDWASAEGIGTVLGLVQDWDTAEGVVVRSGDGQTFLKIKSAWYFAQHALRWHMTYDSIVRFCLDGGITTEEQLSDGLAKAGWDFEIIVTAKEHFALYAQRRAEADAIKAAAYAFLADVAAEGTIHDDERARRKDFALRLVGPGAPQELQRIRPFAFFAYDGKESALDAALLRHVIYQRK